MRASCTFRVFCTFIKKRWNNAFFVPSVQGQVRDGFSSDNKSMQVDGLIGWGTFGARQVRTWRAPTSKLARANLIVGARQVQTWRANLRLGAPTCEFARAQAREANFGTFVPCMVSITWHTRNTWEYWGKKGGFGRKGYVACTGGYECIMQNACIGGLGNTSSLPIVMINLVFEDTPFWALGVYGRILKAPIPHYTAVYSGVYGRILRVYGRILGVFVCITWLFQVEKFHCCAFCAHLVALIAFDQQLHTT